MAFEKNFYEIDAFGFTIVDNFISREKSNHLMRCLDKALHDDIDRYGSNPYKKPNLIPNLALYGNEFLQFLDHDIMHAFFTHFLGDTCILYTYSSTILKSGEVGDSSKIHIDAPRLIPNYYSALQMTLALTDFTEETGATLYLPGSHRIEETPSEDTFNRYAIQTSRKAGSALFWNPRTFHKAGMNQTQNSRYALSTYAVRSFMKPRFDFPRCLQNADLSQVSERVKRFLGFNVRVPASMEEFYVDPQNRLYQANQG